MSEKNRDDKNRWRNVTIAFRMSPKENEELNNRVKLSGFRTKQDYIIQSVLHQKVVATGNPLMLVQFRKNLQQIERELERIEEASDMDGGAADSHPLHAGNIGRLQRTAENISRYEETYCTE